MNEYNDDIFTTNVIDDSEEMFYSDADTADEIALILAR
jgi:hypothetical protein